MFIHSPDMSLGLDPSPFLPLLVSRRKQKPWDNHPKVRNSVFQTPVDTTCSANSDAVLLLHPWIGMQSEQVKENLIESTMPA